jgi:hypothetical protein
VIRDNLHLQVLHGLRTAPSQQEMREAVGAVVNIFLDGVGLTRSGTSWWRT